jgi:hypothetical protein
VPPNLHFTPAFGLVVIGLGDDSSHARLIAPIKEALEPIVELVTPVPYTALQQMFDESVPWDMYSYEKAVYLDDLTDGAIVARLYLLARSWDVADPLAHSESGTWSGPHA